MSYGADLGEAKDHNLLNTSRVHKFTFQSPGSDSAHRPVQEAELNQFLELVQNLVLIFFV